MSVIMSKQRPRKCTMVGSNGRKYPYLLKGHEDLRQDERVMQLFGLVNTLLANDRECSRREAATVEGRSRRRRRWPGMPSDEPMSSCSRTAMRSSSGWIAGNRARRALRRRPIPATTSVRSRCDALAVMDHSAGFSSSIR